MVVEYSFLLSHLSLPLEELTLKLIVKCSGLKSKPDGPLLFGVFYCPPNSDAIVLDEINAAISAIPGNQSIVLCGDFNAPNIDWSYWLLPLSHHLLILHFVLLVMIIFNSTTFFTN